MLFLPFMLIPLALALLGAWVGSTLIVHHGGPGWVAAVAAVTAFFLLPLLWELVADPDQRGGRLRDAISRSSVLSLVLLVGLIGTHPKQTFEALATRGDWFLGASRSPESESVRRVLFVLADRLEWLNDWVREKPFAHLDDSAGVPSPSPSARFSLGFDRDAEDPADPEAPPSSRASRDRPRHDRTSPDHNPTPHLATPQDGSWRIPGTSLSWPLPAEIPRAVRAMPASARASIASIAAWLKAEFPDPVVRARALHDVVALHVAYDVPRLRSGELTARSQKAETVLATGLGVCSGYANLTAEVGRAAGLEVVRLSGDSRNAGDFTRATEEALELDSTIGHAWNAIKLNGHWLFLDVTWDAGHISTGAFTRDYSTTYLFIPADVMILDHRAYEDAWQLLDEPLSRAAWLRQPLMNPRARILGVSPVDFDRPIIGAREPLSFRLAYDPRRDLSFAGRVEVEGDTSAREPVRCEATASRPGEATVTCPPPGERARVTFFAFVDGANRGRDIGAVIVD
jgi:transglutaminase-like putative cysteine protease